MPCTATATTNARAPRALHPLVLEDHPHPAKSDPSSRRCGLYVDVETTGFDPERDAIIELAMFPFTYTLDGAITHVHRDRARIWRQDPGGPIPPEIARITGLTDLDLAGQAIDVAAADALIRSSHLIVAHNATFDRSFVESVVPAAEIPTVRLWAADAPFAAKDQLRRRGYRWMPAEREGIPRSWWTDVSPCDLEDEFVWLGDIFRQHGRLLDPAYLPRREITAHDRWRADPLALHC